jgi:membrane-bound lytic murein transglycosylase D
MGTQRLVVGWGGAPAGTTVAEKAAAPGAALPAESTLERRLARLYDYRAQILRVQGQSRTRTGAILDLAMADLVALLRSEPSALENERFRRVYRALTSAYERYHGHQRDSLLAAQGEVFASRAQLFAALDAEGAPLLEDLSPAEAAEAKETRRKITSAVAMPVNGLVEQSIAYLTKQPDRYVNNWRRRAGTYFPMIEHILEEEGVPEELKYLAMIESGLNPRARSWAAAVGLWQFIASTGRAYDLDVTARVDERRDPEKATRAAARHLRDLYERFDDWHLALAAYNCGAGCVEGAVREEGTEGATFWDIHEHLPRETRGYVPMFVAATLVASNPEGYDLASVDPGPAYAYDRVPVREALTLGRVAEWAETSVDRLRALNPELKGSRLPAGGEPYSLRLPHGAYEAHFAENYDGPVGEVASVRYEPEGVREVVQPDPAPEQASSAEQRERAGASEASRRSQPRASENRRRTDRDEQRGARTTHVVRQGHTLTAIARRYEVSVADLRRWNDLRGSTIHPGQRLVARGEAKTHTVRPGQSLSGIAQRYGTSAGRFKALNDLASSVIHPGQRLQLPR